MSTLKLFALEEPDFGPLSLELGLGVSVIVDERAPRLGRLAEILAGVRRSRGGRALLGERDLYTTREARASTWSLLPREEFTARDSEETVARVLGDIARWKGDHEPIEPRLDQAGLGRYAPARAAELDPEQCRALMLALALTARAPEALILHDPLACVPWLEEAFIVQRCRAQAQLCPVLVTTSALLDAARLGGSVSLLWGKNWITPRELVAPTPSWVAVSVRARPIRALANALAERAWITSFRVDAELPDGSSDSAPDAAGVLTLQGHDLAALSALVVNIALEQGTALELIEPLGRVPYGGR
ncbi:MAG TPA: hypothetical protein VFQ61_00325 [Polyangiaceae bacterium]|nr:hypothetical protein [Polyangiaceae bacterium]